MFDCQRVFAATEEIAELEAIVASDRDWKIIESAILNPPAANEALKAAIIDKSRIVRAIGHLDDVYMEELAKALATILGLPLV